MTVASPEVRLAELKLELAVVRPPAGTFVHAVRTGSLLFVGGHFPIRDDGSIVQGKLGAELDVDAGYEAARLAALSALATVRAELGSLDHVHRIVRLHGLVNSTPEFMQHTQVMNGASDLFVAVYGESRAARTARRRRVVVAIQPRIGDRTHRRNRGVNVSRAPRLSRALRPTLRRADDDHSIG